MRLKVSDPGLIAKIRTSSELQISGDAVWTDWQGVFIYGFGYIINPHGYDHFSVCQSAARNWMMNGLLFSDLKQ